ncbi:glycerophosphoryl diester phosphodiesterase membrane domain-containing protein [Caulobacter sp. KR2-114]|uniref:glycerophosphoryl diester phosphodiesterase membrane domain-containing protein n=1 Tax=Caulobacter sp. KR2-114 TaxID=3400912 RepID=UPI003C08D046
MALEIGPRDSLDIGKVLAGAVSAGRARLGDLLIVAVFFLLLPQVLLGFAPGKFPDPEYGFWNFLASLPGMVFDGAAGLILYGALSGGGAEPPAAGAIRGALRRLARIFMVQVVAGVGIVLGLVLLIAPGLFLASVWLVATPLLVIEDTTVAGALRRSLDLSKGSRWRLLAILGIMTLIVVGLAIVFGGVLGVLIATAGPADMQERLIKFIVTPILAVLVRVVTLSVITSTYAELRRIEAGATTRQVAQTFE